MKVLVIGNGGREHTLAWKLRQSSRVSHIYVAPGNAGTSKIAQNVNISVTDVNTLVSFVKKEQIDLVVVGPEDALMAGVVDAMETAGVAVFGPRADGARLEGSKIWTKMLMKEFGIPTARFEVFDDYEPARLYCEKETYPLVIKADGLAKGKGVFVCQNYEEALAVLKHLIVEKGLGELNSQVVIEECLFGQEASFMFFTDGQSISVTPTSQDHKQIYDGDRGPNTGGMGAYTPVAIVTSELEQRCLDEIAYPLLKALNERGITYKGVVCSNLMLTDKGPYVLEFNARFGDPEAEIILPLMETDFVDVIEAIINNRLSDINIRWSSQVAISIAIAAKGYPEDTITGDLITGLDDQVEQTITFHAGTALQNDEVITAGGRVLIITALGPTLADARDKAYQRIAQIRFDGLQYRRDIGWKSLNTQIS